MLRKILKVVGALVALVVVLVVGTLGWATVTWPLDYGEVEAPTIEASDDPTVIAKGEYLFHHVAHCTACHTPKDTVRALEAGELAVPSGGAKWELGPIGTVRSPNLTPDEQTGIEGWSDADLARVIRHSIRPDGTPALLMNLAGPMSDEDLTAIISYMRTLEPVRNEVQSSEITAIGKVVARLVMPIVASRRPEQMPVPDYVPAGEASAGRGEYLAQGPAMCAYCHTKMDLTTGKLQGELLSGGSPEPDPTDPEMEIMAPNITTGGKLANWNLAAFKNRMRAGRVVKGSSMPWENFRGMTDADLESIYLYLKSVEPSDRAPGPTHRKAGWTPEEG